MDTIKLVPLTEENQHVLDIMFLEEYSGNFIHDHNTRKPTREKHKERLIELSSKKLACVIMVGGDIAGFILVTGNYNILVGGLFPKYRGKGIYIKARNTVINILNHNGLYYILNTVRRSNRDMRKFMSKVPHTMVDDETYLSHHDIYMPDVDYDRSISKSFKVQNHEDKFYHLSTRGDLAGNVSPKVPAGTNDVKWMYSEPSYPRTCFSPSPDLALRAIYPNHSKNFEESKSTHMEFFVYVVEDLNWKKTVSPQTLVEDALVHDAHVTLEFHTTDKCTFKLAGKMLFKCDPDDKGLYYKPYLTEGPWYSSPLSIESRELR